MNICAASLSDLPEILRLFDAARAFMAQNGNPNQWKPGYPLPSTVENDIRQGNFYLIKQGTHVCGCFAFIIGADDTYRHIEQGEWLSESTYGTIHRLASDGTARGIFQTALEFCVSKCCHIRADTHADNTVMQKLLIKHGFSYRGIIYVADGTPRYAYELLPAQEGEVL